MRERLRRARARAGRSRRDPTAGCCVLQTLLGAQPISCGAPRRLPGEGAARGQAADELGRPGRRLRERACRRWARAARRRVPDDSTRSSPRVRRGRPRARRSASSLLKLTAPGVPDIYGGDELEFLALVDPDNRRPVDFDARRRALAAGPTEAQHHPHPPRPPASAAATSRSTPARTAWPTAAAAAASSSSPCAAPPGCAA